MNRIDCMTCACDDAVAVLHILLLLLLKYSVVMEILHMTGQMEGKGREGYDMMMNWNGMA